MDDREINAGSSSYPLKKFSHRGDDGSTSLYGGERVGKDSYRIELLGTLDELSAFLGLARTESHFPETKNFIREIQETLLTAAARLADVRQIKTEPFSAEKIDRLDYLLKTITDSLPELTHFILPGENRSSALLHVARTVARRAERIAVVLHREEPVEPNLLAWLNRLSTLLFQLARKEESLT